MDKKELKFIYKNTNHPMGVFQIRNNANGKVLMGSSLNLDARRNRFAFERQNGSFSNNHEMKKDWDKLGPENFTFEILEQLKRNKDPQHNYRSDLADLERKWLEKLKPFGERGYNQKKNN